MKTRKKSADTTKQTAGLTLTDTTFNKKTSRGVVLIDFWAPWCGPCLRQGPIIEQVAAAMAGQVKVGKYNVDKEAKFARRFGIKGIPTLVVLKGGKEVERFIGVQQEAVLIAALEKHVKCKA